MKKRIIIVGAIIALLLCCFFLLFGGKNITRKQLIDRYLTAVQEKDYEAIWSMIPKEIQEYAIDEDIIADKDSGLRYIKYAVKNYYWLREAALPTSDKFSFVITEHDESDAQAAQEYFQKKCGIRIDIDATAKDDFEITIDGERTVSALLCMIKTKGQWWLVSVVGHSVAFEY